MSDSQRTADRPASGCGHPRAPLVVLAEDHDDTRCVYALILEHYGYRVAAAITGVDAVELTRTMRPDLVLLDIGLPVMNGWEASRLLKADPRTSSIPLVAFSARVDSISDLEGNSPTFDGYILKPISPLELVQRVAAYLELFRPGQTKPSAPPVPLEPFVPDPRLLDEGGSQEQRAEH